MTFKKTVDSLLPLAITMGDASGVGPEIIIKAWHEGLEPPVVVYGDIGILRRAVELLGSYVSLIELEHISQFSKRTCGIEVVPGFPTLPLSLPVGQVNRTAGLAAYSYICSAIDDIQSGYLSAIVTAPINKKSLNLAGIEQPGHTEILAGRCDVKNFAMMLVNDELRVLLVTIHMSLLEAIANINRDSELRAIHLAQQACRQLGIKHPRIAVAGLNPHAGEKGRFGSEESDIIEPAVNLAKIQGIDVSGPWPSDTVFMRARRGEFDIVVAQYHDQGLIPIKYAGLDQGVNITVGLPFIRTSVEHGTAFDIAWQGKANHHSLVKACQVARKLIQANPLR